MTPTLTTLLNGYSLTSDQGNPAFCSVHLIESGAGRVLFDCGHAGRRRRLLEELSAHGLEPADIGTVVLSHGHWDHLQNVDFFRHARVLLHADELRNLDAPPADDLGTPRWAKAVLQDLDVHPTGEGRPAHPGRGGAGSPRPYPRIDRPHRDHRCGNHRAHRRRRADCRRTALRPRLGPVRTTQRGRTRRSNESRVSPASSARGTTRPSGSARDWSTPRARSRWSSGEEAAPLSRRRRETDCGADVEPGRGTAGGRPLHCRAVPTYAVRDRRRAAGVAE